MIRLPALPRPHKHERPPTKVTMKELWEHPPTLDQLRDLDSARSELQEKYGDDFHIDDLLVVPGVRVKGGFRHGSYTAYGELIGARMEPTLWDRTLGFGPSRLMIYVRSTTDPRLSWKGSAEQYYESFCVD